MKHPQTTKKITRFKYLRALLVLLLALAVCTLGEITARFVSRAVGSDSASVAKFDVTVAGTMTESFGISESELAPGESFEKTVSVTNNSDVTMKYTVRVESTGNLPLDFSWTEYSKTLGVGESDSHDLTVTWRAGEKSFLYSQEVDDVRIHVTCEQVD